MGDQEEYTYEKYKLHLKKNREWGENSDIPYISAMLNVNIFIFLYNDYKVHFPLTIPNLTFDINRPTILIYFLGNMHFEPIILMNKNNQDDIKYIFDSESDFIQSIAQLYIDYSQVDDAFSFMRNWITPNYDYKCGSDNGEYSY